MNPQIFSVSGKDILYNAKQIAIASCHERLTTTHITLAVFRSRDFSLTEIFQTLKVDLHSFQEHLRQKLENIPKVGKTAFFGKKNCLKEMFPKPEGCSTYGTRLK